MADQEGGLADPLRDEVAQLGGPVVKREVVGAREAVRLGRVAVPCAGWRAAGRPSAAGAWRARGCIAESSSTDLKGGQAFREGTAALAGRQTLHTVLAAQRALNAVRPAPPHPAGRWQRPGSAAPAGPGCAGSARSRRQSRARIATLAPRRRCAGSGCASPASASSLPRRGKKAC